MNNRFQTKVLIVICLVMSVLAVANVIRLSNKPDPVSTNTFHVQTTSQDEDGKTDSKEETDSQFSQSTETVTDFDTPQCLEDSFE